MDEVNKLIILSDGSITTAGEHTASMERLRKRFRDLCDNKEAREEFVELLKETQRNGSMPVRRFDELHAKHGGRCNQQSSNVGPIMN